MTAPASGGGKLALVTGGQGFIGSHLCACLLEKGHRVRVLARPGSDPSHLSGLDVALVRGDLTQEASLAQAVEGVDWVFHLAGALKGFQPEDLLRVNREGTRRLVQACQTHAPALDRFVAVSSLAAMGPSPGGNLPLTEAMPRHPLTWYGASKLAGEAVVREASNLPWVILRPPVVFGPRDRDVLGYFRMVSRGWLPLPGRRERKYSVIYAPDLAQGILRAAESPQAPGEIFHLTHPDPVSWLELGQRMAVALGRSGRVLHLPEGLVRTAGCLADLAARVQGRPQIFSSQKVKEMLAPGWIASPEKTLDRLGWSAPTPLDEALALTVRWYRDHGWL